MASAELSRRVEKVLGRMTQKRCGKCEEEKPLAEFSHARSRKDGRAAHCKACVRRWQQENAERLADYHRRWQQANRDKTRAQDRRYRERRAQDPAYRERRRANDRRYRERRAQDPNYWERRRANNRRYRERIREAPRNTPGTSEAAGSGSEHRAGLSCRPSKTGVSFP
jgi:hypothetical protein